MNQIHRALSYSFVAKLQVNLLLTIYNLTECKSTYYLLFTTYQSASQLTTYYLLLTDHDLPNNHSLPINDSHKVSSIVK